VRKRKKRNKTLEATMTLSIKKTIADLADNNKPLVNSKLIDLSNLSPEELRIFGQRWAAIEPKRRRQIVHRLVELSENNFTLNFNSIFKYCLKDQDAEVRSKAIDGLWEDEEASLIDLLINLLEQDSSEKVQATAATALNKFATLAEHKKLRPCHTSKINQALLTAINDETKALEVRCRALEAAAPLSLSQVKKAIPGHALNWKKKKPSPLSKILLTTPIMMFSLLLFKR